MKAAKEDGGIRDAVFVKYDDKGKGQIVGVKIKFWAKTKKDLKDCKDGNGVEKASYFLSLARVMGFESDYMYPHGFGENYTIITVQKPNTFLHW